MQIKFPTQEFKSTGPEYYNWNIKKKSQKHGKTSFFSVCVGRLGWPCQCSIRETDLREGGRFSVID